MLDQPTTVIANIFKAFGGGAPKRVILTKVSKVSDHKHSQPLPLQSTVHGKLWFMPTVGESFNLREVITKKPDGSEDTFKEWYTSPIVEFLPDNTFKTQNSVYKYQIL